MLPQHSYGHNIIMLQQVDQVIVESTSICWQKIGSVSQAS